METGESAKPKRRRKWLRGLAWTVSAALLFAIAIPAVILGSLRFQGVRDRVTARISKVLEREAGATLRAGDFDVHPWGGTVEIRDVELAAIGHPATPFLTAAVVRARLDVRALFRGDVLVSDLLVGHPRLVVEAPFPSVPPRAESKRAGGRFEVRPFALEGAEIVGGAGSRIAEIAATGSFSGGRIDAVVTHAEAHVVAYERPFDLEIEASVSGGLDGTFDVRALTARGAGIAIDGRGAGSLHPHTKVEATYDARADLALVAGDLFSKGSVVLSGTAAIDGEPTRPRGKVRFEARDVSADRAASLVPFELPPALKVTGTQVDATGDLEVDLRGAASLADPPADAIRGTTSLAWRRGDARLLDAALRSEPGSGAAGGTAKLTLGATMFPDAAGERRLEGGATLRSFTDLSKIDVAAKLHVIEPRAADAIERLGIRVSWPEGRAPTAALEATLEAAGPLEAPRVVADAVLREDEETLAIVSATSVPGWRGWRSGLALDIEASVLPGQPGTREASARLAGLTIRDGIVRIEEPDLGLAVLDFARRAGMALPVEESRLEAMLDGPLQATAHLAGPVSDPRVSLDATWRPGGAGSVAIAAVGHASGAAPYVTLEKDATLSARDVDGALLGFPGYVVRELEATSDGGSVEVGRLVASLPPIAPSAAGGQLVGHGSFDLAWPPRTADLEVTVEHPLDGVERASAHARLEGGVLEVEGLEARSGAATATLDGSVPLGSLAPYAGALRETLAGYAAGPITVEADGVDLTALGAVLFPSGGVPVPSGTASARLRIDAERPALSSGSVEIRAFALALEDHRLEAAGPIRIALDDGKAVLPPVALRAAGPNVPEDQTAEVSGTVTLAKDWTVERGLAGVIEDLSADLHGKIDAAWLTRLAGQGSGSGSVAVEASLRGPVEGLTGEVSVSGPDARISFYSPYATRFESFEAHAGMRGGVVVIDTAKARWNGGDLAIHGIARRDGAHLTASFEKVSYRLDYGATARIDGKLELEWPKEGDRLLSGTLHVDRASVRRDIPLSGEMLRSLFEPESVADSELLDTIRLDVDVTTEQGVRIKNNLADLRADWDPLHVTGSLAAPLVTGEAHVDPGGLLNLLGSIVRIEEGRLTWAGVPPSSPRLAMRTTTSLEDPTIKNQWYHTWYQAPVMGPGEGGTMDLNADRASSAEVMNAFAAGVMTYYQDRIASAVSSGFTQTEVSYQPLSLFGETDTTARMTISQRLSRWATFLASSDPTDPEAQTFILDLHGFDLAPSLSAQLFTNDEKNEGATLQQTMRLGRGREESETGERLRKVRIEAPKGISKTKLKKAISYRSGDAVPEGAEMDVEIDVVDALHRRGYPLAEATATFTPHKKRGVNLSVRVVPGPKVHSEFDGDRPRRADRRAIAALYRVGDEEKDSLETIRQQTVRALQSRGFLDPQVEVRVDPKDEKGRTILRVTSTGGRKVDPDVPRFEGVPADKEESLAAIFPTKLSRISLASAAPTADQRVARALAAAGYPSARVASRELSQDGKDLVVRVDAGERQRLTSVELTGLYSEDWARVHPLLEVRAGDPIEADAIARSIVSIEGVMRRRGHAQAAVTAKLAPVSPEHPFERALTFDVTPGPTYRVDEVRFRGTGTSKESWLEKTSGLTAGEPLDPQEISKARARLGRTGVFQEIDVSTDPPTDRSSTAPVDPGTPIPADVEFDLTERKRWQLAYGGRYESSKGLGFVTDLYNFNSFGRGQTTGFRGLYSEEDSRVQVYHSIPRVIGERSSLETFVEWQKELEEGVWSEGEKAWVQLTFPPAGGWQNRTYVQFENRSLTAEDPDPAAPLDERTISPAIGWQLVYDARVRASAVVAREHGFFYGLNLLGTSKDLGSDFSGIASYQQWSFFWPFGDPKRGRLAWNHSYRIDTANVIDDELPFDSLLRAGGEFSVRGYPTNSLGPQDADGNALGGEFLVLANEELHLFLGRGVSTLVFMDFGNVWPTFDEVDWRLSSSYGVGFRWASPAGPLRLDWAVPLDRRAGDPHSTVYFGFGNVF